VRVSRAFEVGANLRRHLEWLRKSREQSIYVAESSMKTVRAHTHFPHPQIALIAAFGGRNVDL
jgi:hypothetical protein